MSFTSSKYYRFPKKEFEKKRLTKSNSFAKQRGFERITEYGSTLNQKRKCNKLKLKDPKKWKNYDNYDKYQGIHRELIS